MGATWEAQEGRVWLILPGQTAHIYIYPRVNQSSGARVVNGGLNCIIQPFQPGSLTQDDIINYLQILYSRCGDLPFLLNEVHLISYKTQGAFDEQMRLCIWWTGRG